MISLSDNGRRLGKVSTIRSGPLLLAGLGIRFLFFVKTCRDLDFLLTHCQRVGLIIQDNILLFLYPRTCKYLLRSCRGT